MRLLRLLLLTLLLLPALSHAASLKIELISNTTHIRPNEPFEVGLRLRHPSGYHTYWKHPGVVGVPTRMEWALPKGWKAAPIQWPAPKRIFMFQIRAQGYHDEVILPIQITPGPDLIPGTNVTLKGRATWMCCGRECNPGFKDLKIELPVSAAPPQPSKTWGKAFATAKASIAQPLQSWEASASIKNKDITILLTPSAKDPSIKKHAEVIHDIIYFTEDGLINPDTEQRIEKFQDGRIAIHLTQSEYFEGSIPATIAGIVQTPQQWTPHGPTSASIRVPLKNRY
jgi:DsbC/DsbD-like thiol-disulfide interchange protein